MSMNRPMPLHARIIVTYTKTTPRSRLIGSFSRPLSLTRGYFGPVLTGLSKPVHVPQRGAAVSDIVNMVALAVVEAQGSPESTERKRARAKDLGVYAALVAFRKEIVTTVNRMNRSNRSVTVAARFRKSRDSNGAV
jgi:hypothetical protein